jgi:hypothetical protein
VELNYVRGLSTVLIIEVKLAKIAHCDPNIIAKKHQDNKAEAEPQVRDYVWAGTPVKTQQRVVVSGVWHPRSPDSTEFEMSTQYWFLDVDINKADSSTTAYEYRLPF